MPGSIENDEPPRAFWHRHSGEIARAGRRKKQGVVGQKNSRRQRHVMQHVEFSVL
jgi:hypothetical protein